MSEVWLPNLEILLDINIIYSIKSINGVNCEMISTVL